MAEKDPIPGLSVEFGSPEGQRETPLPAGMVSPNQSPRSRNIIPSANSDDVTSQVIRAQQAKELERLRQEAEGYMAQHGQNIVQEEEEKVDPQDPLGVRILKDVGRGVFELPVAMAGGVTTAGKEFFEALDSMGNWLNDNVADLKFNVPSISPEVDKFVKPFLNPAESTAKGFEGMTPDNPITVTGEVAKGVSQFLTGFIPILKGIKATQGPATTALGRFAQIETAAGTAGALVFDPLEEKLSNLIESFPELSNPVTRFLQSKPDDTEAEGRLKSALEGLGLGILGEGLYRAVRAIRQHRISTGHTPQRPVGAPEEPIPTQLGDRDGPSIVPSRPEGPKITKAEAKEAAERYLNGDIPADQLPFKINWARYNSVEDADQVFNDIAQLFRGKIDKNRRETINDQELFELAESIGMSPEDLLRMQPGGVLNAEQVIAAKFILESSADMLQHLARIARDTTDNAIIHDFHRMVKIHAGLQMKFQGAASEAGRAFRALQLPVGSRAKQLEAIAEMMSEEGGTEQIRRLARAVAESNDRNAINRAVRGTLTKRISDAIVEMWYFNLLSGPQTHAVNVTSSAMKTIYRIPERALAARIARLRGTQSVQEGEAEQMLYGLIQALPGAFRAAYRAFRDNVPSDQFGKMEVRQDAAISSRSFGLNAQPGSFGSIVGKGLDALGTIARLPTRALMMEDEFFRYVSRSMQVQARAYREAVSEGLEGDALAFRVDQLVRNPPQEFLDDALTFSRQNTWTEPLGPLGQQIQRSANYPGWNVIAKSALPFIRTPANLIKDAQTFTPLGMLRTKVRNEVKAGSAMGDTYLAQIAIGSFLSLAVADQVWKGNVTGYGPIDPDLRATYRRVKQPFSIKAGDTWYSYNRLDPLGLFVGAIASYAEMAGSLAPQDREDLALAIATATSKSVFSKTWMQGPSEMLEAITNPDKSMDQWIKQQAGTFLMPTGAAQVARNIDPVWREVYDLIDAVKARTPGFSNTLPPVRNLWGEPIWLEGGLGPDIVSPVYKMDEKYRPIDNWLMDNFVEVSMPQRIRGGVELDPWQYDRYVELAGNLAKDPSTGLGAYDTLNALIEGRHPMSDAWATQTDGPIGGKSIIVKAIVSSFREMAWAQLLEGDQALRRRVEERAAEAAKALQETNMNPQGGRLP